MNAKFSLCTKNCSHTLRNENALSHSSPTSWLVLRCSCTEQGSLELYVIFDWNNCAISNRLPVKRQWKTGGFRFWPL